MRLFSKSSMRCDVYNYLVVLFSHVLMRFVNTVKFFKYIYLVFSWTASFLPLFTKPLLSSHANNVPIIIVQYEALNFFSFLFSSWVLRNMPVPNLCLYFHDSNAMVLIFCFLKVLETAIVSMPAYLLYISCYCDLGA